MYVSIYYAHIIYHMQGSPVPHDEAWFEAHAWRPGLGLCMFSIQTSAPLISVTVGIE